MKKLPVVFIVLFFYLFSNKVLAEVPTATALLKNKLSKNESSKYEEVKSVFVLSPNTTLSINEDVILTVSSDVVLWSNIQGEGIFLIKGNPSTLLDAHNFEINKLHLENKNRLELRSPLTIGGELSIIEGSLYLNDFNITLNASALLIHSGKLGHLVFNGRGFIITKDKQPLISTKLPHSTVKTPYYYSVTLVSLNNVSTTENFLSVGSVFKPFQLISPKPPP